MAGQIPGGADDAPDLAIAELSEETTPPLCSLRMTETSAGTVAAVLRAYRGMPDRFRWLEGAEGHRRVWSARQLRLDRLFFTTTMP